MKTGNILVTSFTWAYIVKSFEIFLLLNIRTTATNFCPVLRVFCFNPFPNKPWFLLVCSVSFSFENTAGKGEIARDEQFLLFPSCFLPIWRTFCHLHQIQHCRLQTLSLEESKIDRLGNS